MAAPRGLPDAPLKDRLYDEPYRFDFFQAVRLLERIKAGREGPGRAGSPRREVVRFRTVQGLVFPPSSIAELRPGADDHKPDTMTVAFLGLTGPLGVLPHCYSDLVLERQRAGDHSLAEFLDLFNHRLVSLFFRAWSKHRPAALATDPAGDPVSDALLSLVGLGLESLRERMSVPDRAARYYAGWLAQRHRSAVGLEMVLRDYFGITVQVHQFQGAWLRLAVEDQSRLSRSGRFNQLGVDPILGERTWDEQGRFRIQVGPLSWADFAAFAPGGESFRAMVHLARLYVDAELDFDIQLVLKASDVPACRLGGDGQAGRLGQSAWLLSGPAQADAVDAVFPAGELAPAS